MSIPEHLQIVLGNGSDELIQLLALAVAAPDATILAPEPSFVMYKMIAAFTGMRYLAVELDESFDLDVAAMLAALDEHQPELVFFAQPNNPTGNVYSEERLRQVVAACSGIVVLDEAYTPFTDADFLSWVDEYPNVVVMRTLSKVGLAGLRLGIMIGRPALMSEIDKLRLPYNISVLTQASAAFALRHYPVFEAQANEIRRSRELLKDAVNALPGLECWESEANFLLVYCRNHDPVQLHSALKLRGILVKNLHGSHPRLAQCLRLTVGTPAENESLLSELGQLTG
jgi:histidinol-phosphate aminotransferase